MSTETETTESTESTESTETAAGPQPYMKGIFSLYHTPDGGIHIAYRAEGTEQDEHMQVPGVFMRIIREAAETGTMPNPLTLLRMLRKAG